MAGTTTRQNRTRIVLAAALVVMFLLLIAQGVFFVRVLTPVRSGSVRGSEGPSGLVWVRSLYGYGQTASQQLAGTAAVAIGPDGTIFATDPGHKRVMAFAPDGTFRRLYGTQASDTKGRGKLVRPLGVAVDSAGNLYVSDVNAGMIRVYRPDGSLLREWPVKNVQGIGITRDKLYALVGGFVQTFTLEGQRLSSFAGPGRKPEQTTAVYGVTSDGDKVFVADDNNNAVKAFDSRGKLLWMMSGSALTKVTSQSLDTTSSPENVIQIPQALVIDAKGRLVVIDAFSFKLAAFNKETGKLIAAYGTSGSADGQFMYPSGVAYDPARDWFAVADTMNNRVQIVRIPGSGDTAATGARRALSSPLRMCAVPLILLLIALVVLATMRRRDRSHNELDEDAPTNGTMNESVDADTPI